MRYLRQFFYDRFGTKRGAFNKAIIYFLYKTGRFNKFSSIDKANISRLVFICKGNVCRSPFAEEIAKKNGVNVISFGLETDGNTPANKDVVRVAKKIGIDLSSHCSAKFDSDKIKSGDLIIGMEPKHCLEISKYKYPNNVQISLLGTLAKKGKTAYIHDPYGLSDGYIYNCLILIKRCVEGICNDLKK